MLTGIDDFDGEGVSPFTLPADPADLPSDVSAQIVAGVPAGQSVRQPGNDVRSATPQDAALFVAEAGAGRIAGHFDRNTFFNLNGAGSDIQTLDNEQLALNIFEFITTPGTLLGDVNTDGVVDFLDIQPFIDLLSSETFQAQADIDGNGIVNFFDISGFIAILSGTST